mgnify:CR=1 FL=1
MRGVQFVVDESGNKTAVMIDLQLNRELWEDMFDTAVAKSREDEQRLSLKEVEEHLGPSPQGD